MRRPLLSRPFLLGALTAFLCCSAIGACIGIWMVFFGGFDAGANKQHSTGLAWVTHEAMTSSVRRRARDVQPPAAFTPAQMKAGAAEYESHCVACHGGPAVPRALWASAMLPTPPYIIDSPQRWSRAELYVLVRDGVKLTAMPAWGEIGPDERIWDVVAFLEKLPSLSAADFARVRSEAKQAPSQGEPRVGNPLLP